MSQPVTIPIFGSTSTQHPQQQAAGSSDWYMEDGEQDMDFDLLAEYLLEENPDSSHTGGFDFNTDFVVSPETSVVGAGDNGAAQARDIITQHAATIAAAPVPVAAPAVAQVQYAPVAAPPPLVMSPQIAAQGMAVPQTIPQYIPAQPMAPAPAATHQTRAPVRTTQKKTTDTKRRRTNPPEVAAQGLINTSYMTNGTANMSPAVVAAAAAAAAMQGRGRKKTQAQIDRRRERNRILARRTRLRKKFFFESLQKEVMELQKENAALRDIVRSEIEGEEGRALLEQCNASRKLPREVLEACGENPDLDQEDFNLVTSIQQSQHSFVITDPSLQDNPIVFASDDFLTLTGYSREDVLGRNCRFLQGTNTSKQKLDMIRKGLATGDDISVTLVNYTVDGTPFWNKLFIAALRDAQNNIVNFIGVIVKVASPEPGDPDFGKTLTNENEAKEGPDADGTVKAIEGVVDAAVAAAPSVLSG
eukprot:CAMPEP_0116114658 /NCGR_PEP_ID=MMETSP0329-20121206/96_1 /TAXON_ID=697910 /ORGANISM="Pseudo-nitzschia arenysensis, Strain B593" /LENGTH=473 /DNA_ID=CAMNT_0003608049 /DNA_START=1147 /DNA_END=2568 /DNA_ORIENTATION=+